MFIYLITYYLSVTFWSPPEPPSRHQHAPINLRDLQYNSTTMFLYLFIYLRYFPLLQTLHPRASLPLASLPSQYPPIKLEHHRHNTASSFIYLLVSFHHLHSPVPPSLTITVSAHQLSSRIHNTIPCPNIFLYSFIYYFLLPSELPRLPPPLPSSPPPQYPPITPRLHQYSPVITPGGQNQPVSLAPFH